MEHNLLTLEFGGILSHMKDVPFRRARSGARL